MTARNVSTQSSMIDPELCMLQFRQIPEYWVAMCDAMMDAQDGSDDPAEPARQCDMSTGTVMASSTVRVVPPSMSSRRRG